MVNDEDMHARIEWNDGQPFIHLTLHRWTPRVARLVVSRMLELERMLRQRGYKYIFTYNRNQDDKWRKFMDFVQYKKLFTFKGLDVYYTEI